ncbi:MAG: hypothetical protein GX442_01625 [Candidatus Riflebacteria bacterium]|nr:hypothetical protein [Candidatus Riflebacteria bacterium]
MSEPPAGLLPARLEVPSPTLRERSLPVVAAGRVSARPLSFDERQGESPESPMAGEPTHAVPGAPPSRPGWQGETPVYGIGGGPTDTVSEGPLWREGGRGEMPASPIARGVAGRISEAPPDHPGGRGEAPGSPPARGPSIPWVKDWLRPWAQALAVAGAAALVLVALHTGPRLPDPASGGHQPAPATSLLAQVHFLDPAEEPADLSEEGFPDDLSPEPADGETGDPGEGLTGPTEQGLVPSPFGSAFDGSFEIVVTDPVADVSHEWSFLEMQEPDYTFLDDSEKEESWSEESRG